MAITAYSALLPSMNVRLPDCSAEMIEQALWLAGRNFCVESEAYIVDLTAIDSVADQKKYTLTTPDQFDPLRVIEVRRLTEDEVDDGDKGSIILPTKYDYHIMTNVLEFFTAPFVEAITSGLTVKIALAPQEDEDDTELDFEWVRRWARYIKAGAFAHLLSDDSKPWFSSGKANLEDREFRRGVSMARREVYVGNTTRKLRMTGGSWV